MDAPCSSILYGAPFFILLSSILYKYPKLFGWFTFNPLNKSLLFNFSSIPKAYYSKFHPYPIYCSFAYPFFIHSMYSLSLSLSLCLSFYLSIIYLICIIYHISYIFINHILLINIHTYIESAANYNLPARNNSVPAQ